MAVRYEPLTLPVVPDNRPNYVTVSPDGRYVFAGFNAASIHSSVLTFEASGGSVRQLDLSSIFPSGVTSYAAEFSPDGQWLAVGLADSERFKIFKVDGGLFQEVPLNNKPTLAVPRRIWWSLDSSRVAMVTGANRLEVLTKDAGESFTFVQQGSATIYNYSSVGRGAFSDDNLSCFVPFTSTMEEGEWWKFDGTTYVEQGAQVAPYPAFSYARLPGDRIIGVTSTRTVPQFRVFTGTGFQGDTSAYSVTIGAQSDVRVLGKRVFVTLWNDLANPLYVYELDDNYDWVGPPTRAERFETVSRPYYRGLAGSEDGAILATVEEQSPYLSIHIDETKISKVVYPGFGLSGSLDFIMTPRTGEGSLPIPALTSDGFLGTAEHEEAIAVPKIVASPVTAAVAKGPDISSDDPNFTFGYGDQGIPKLATDGHVRPIHEASGDTSLPTVAVDGEIDVPILSEGGIVLPGLTVEGDLDPKVISIPDGKLSFPNVGTDGFVSVPYFVDPAEIRLPAFSVDGNLTAPVWIAADLSIPPLGADGSAEAPIGGVGTLSIPTFITDGELHVDNSPREITLDAALPAFSASAVGDVEPWFTVSAALPNFTLSGEIWMPEYVIGDPLFPRFSSDGLGAPDYTLDVAASFPRMRVGGWAGPPYVINANTFFPRPTINADAKFGYRLEANVSFPAFRLRAYDTESLTVPTADFGSFVSSLSVGGSGVTFSMTATFKIG